MRIYPKRPIAERLWEKVSKTDSCWIWNGQISSGHPVIWVRDGKVAAVRRMSWKAYYGPIPFGKEIVLGCGNIRCVAPHHMALSIATYLNGLPLEERFWAKVNKNGPLPSTHPEIGNCWIWIAKIEKKFGYGQFEDKPSHKVAWEITYGPVEEGLDVLHKCDVPACCRPDHLWLGDHDANMADMVAKDRQAKGEKVGNSKLTESQVKQIRALRKSGVKLIDLGKQFGVHFSIIWDVEHRVTWKHIS